MNNPKMVQEHRVVHTIHFLLPFEPQPMGNIVPRFVNLNESPIDESSLTLKLMDVHTKGHPFLNNTPSNTIACGLINPQCNENYIITYYILAPIL